MGLLVEGLVGGGVGGLVGGLIGNFVRGSVRRFVEGLVGTKNVSYNVRTTVAFITGGMIVLVG